jgi:cytochrome P450
LLVVPTAVLHRDARWWPEPDRFRPERWLSGGRFVEAAPAVPRGAWLPFGAGARVCVGEPFAWAEGVLVLAALAREWQVRMRDTAVRPQPAVTLRPLGGLRAELARR